MQQQDGGGSVINASSAYGQVGFPDSILYVGGKHAIIGITEAAALGGAAHGIRVIVVAPGFTQAAMYEGVTGSDAVRGAVTSVLPMHRAGGQVAGAVMFLGSGKAAYIAGQILTLDGGLMAGWPLLPAA